MKEESIEEIIKDEAEIEMQGFEYRASLEEFAKRAYIKGRSAQIEAEKQKDERIKSFENKIETLLMLCEENGKPVDGFRFRELILELKHLLNNK